MPDRINIIGEISRMGGGQVYMRDIITSVRSFAKVSLTTDITKDPLNILPLVNETIPVHYTYDESVGYLNETFQIIKLKKYLKKIHLKDGIVINNHPNIFLKNGDLNILHGFSFLDFIIDEYGNINNKLLFRLIKLSNIYKIYDGGHFIANSTYTKDLSFKLFRKLGLKPSSTNILFPTFHSSYKLSEKDRGVLSFQRINRGKKLDTILDVARSSNLHFIIAGAVNQGDQEYFKELIRNKPDNVDIISNPSEAEKENLYLNSKIFLHLNRKEHFGISIVESMSHGLVPVVPKTGGPWLDIVKEGRYGFGYSNLEEIPESLSLAIETTDMKRREIIESTKRFSYDNFSENLRHLIDSVE